MAKNRLTEELRQEIGAVVQSLKVQTFYSLLGVPEESTKEEIKRAYFALSKRFHPDAFFGEELGEHKFHLENIFTSLTRAHDVLSDPRKREKYDNYLKRKRDTRGMEDAAQRNVQDVMSVLRQRADTVPSGISLTMPIAPDSKAARGLKGEGEITDVTEPSAGRKRFDRSLLRKTEISHDQWKAQRLLSALSGVKVHTVPTQGEMKEKKILELMKTAQIEDEEGNYLGAINAIKLAIEYDPNRTELQDIFQRILVKARPLLGQRYYSLGQLEEEFEDLPGAEASYRKAVAYCPDNAEYYFQLAKVLYNGGSTMHEAYEVLKNAIKLSPRDAVYFLLLGKICKKAGLKKAAISALKTVLQLSPKNQEAKDLLREL